MKMKEVPVLEPLMVFQDEGVLASELFLSSASVLTQFLPWLQFTCSVTVGLVHASCSVVCVLCVLLQKHQSLQVLLGIEEFHLIDVLLCD